MSVVNQQSSLSPPQPVYQEIQPAGQVQYMPVSRSSSPRETSISFQQPPLENKWPLDPQPPSLSGPTNGASALSSPRSSINTLPRKPRMHSSASGIVAPIDYSRATQEDSKSQPMTLPNARRNFQRLKRQSAYNLRSPPINHQEITINGARNMPGQPAASLRLTASSPNLLSSVSNRTEPMRLESTVLGKTGPSIACDSVNQFKHQSPRTIQAGYCTAGQYRELHPIGEAAKATQDPDSRAGFLVNAASVRNHHQSFMGSALPPVGKEKRKETKEEKEKRRAEKRQKKEMGSAIPSVEETEKHKETREEKEKRRAERKEKKERKEEREGMRAEKKERKERKERRQDETAQIVQANHQHFSQHNLTDVTIEGAASQPETELYRRDAAKVTVNNFEILEVQSTHEAPKHKGHKRDKSNSKSEAKEATSSPPLTSMALTRKPVPNQPNQFVSSPPQTNSSDRPQGNPVYAHPEHSYSRVAMSYAPQYASSTHALSSANAHKYPGANFGSHGYRPVAQNDNVRTNMHPTRAEKTTGHGQPEETNSSICGWCFSCFGNGSGKEQYVPVHGHVQLTGQLYTGGAAKGNKKSKKSRDGQDYEDDGCVLM